MPGKKHQPNCPQFSLYSLHPFTNRILFRCHYSVGCPCFYFLKYKDPHTHKKNVSSSAWLLSCPLFRGRERLNLYSAGLFIMCHFPSPRKLPSREWLKPPCPHCHRGVTSVVCVGPQPPGNSVSMMKGKYSAEQDLVICSRSKVAQPCNKLPVKSPGHWQRHSYLLRYSRQPKSTH